MNCLRAILPTLLLGTASACASEGPPASAVYVFEEVTDQDTLHLRGDGVDPYSFQYFRSGLVLTPDDANFFHRGVISVQPDRHMQHYPELPVQGPWPRHGWYGLWPWSGSYTVAREDGWWVVRDGQDPTRIFTILHPLDERWDRIALGREDDPYRPEEHIWRRIDERIP